ncbi:MULTISPECIES: class I SAM-dependent methyltransferase [unclassified Nocardioides]|uniref:class I SAM-dependent methyltransferase n=1 Tax=unclassified Nocardioides TaxID=2615069 RepID=UPI003015390B
MGGRALSFGAVAAAYERFRPGYPDRLVDEIEAYAARPVRTALEIGAGTGKATRVLSARGVAVTATDPDAAMLAELRRHVPGTVTTVHASFEELPLNRTHDLVLAAAALHWTRPPGRWPRVAALLAPGGVLASCGGPVELADPDVDAAVRAARGTLLPDDGIVAPDGTPPDSALQWPGTELVASPLFTDVRQLRIERRLTLSADDYVGHLTTISAYRQLPAADLATVLERIRAVLPAEVTLDADLVLHLARSART